MARVLFNIHVTETERIPDIDIFLMKYKYIYGVGTKIVLD